MKELGALLITQQCGLLKMLILLFSTEPLNELIFLFFFLLFLELERFSFSYIFPRLVKKLLRLD